MALKQSLAELKGAITWAASDADVSAKSGKLFSETIVDVGEIFAIGVSELPPVRKSLDASCAFDTES